VSSLGKPVVPSRLSSLVFRHTPRELGPRSKVAAYVALTKPRIIELLLVTTVPTMVLANDGWPSIWLMVATVCGGALAAGGANAVNMYADRDIDSLMERTKNRPLVLGEVSPRGALIFAVVLQLAAFAILWWFANLVAAGLAFGAAVFYVFVYTLWLKRTSRQNIVVGGAAGAVPVLVGWAAVTGSLSWVALALFVFMFLWTPPHFWALAIKHADEYRAAGVPMLPAVATLRHTTNQMVVYAVLLLVSSLAVLPLADLGWIYGTTAMVFGAAFIGGCVQLRKAPSEARAMRLFSFSISYVTALFVAIVVDVLFS